MRNNWTIEQDTIALYLYCIIPFSKVTNSNSLIAKYAPIIGRSVTALKMKIGNFGSLDSRLASNGIVGLGNISRTDSKVWDNYYGHWHRLLTDVHEILGSIGKTEVTLEEFPTGEEITALTKQRVNQSFFRQMVISSYEQKCCISGVQQPCLLHACHIIPWSEDFSLRTNPTNGLCLNSFFHSAYDNFLISITPDYEISISDTLICSIASKPFADYIQGLRHRKISLPSKFIPSRQLLDIHHQTFLSKVQ